MSKYLATVNEELRVTDAGLPIGRGTITLKSGQVFLTKIVNPFGHNNHWLVLLDTKQGMSIQWWNMQTQREVEPTEGDEAGKPKVKAVILEEVEEKPPETADSI